MSRSLKPSPSTSPADATDMPLRTQLTHIDYASADVYDTYSPATDAAMTARYAVALITLTPTQNTKADVTGNGTVSATDAGWIARKAVDSTIKFPVEP